MSKGDDFENVIARELSCWMLGKKYRSASIHDLPFRRQSTSVVPSSGWKGTGDILHHAGKLPNPFCFAVECKKVSGWEMDFLAGVPQKCDPWEWWYQAVIQASAGNLYPLLIFSRNHKPLYFMLERPVALRLDYMHWMERPVAARTPRDAEVVSGLLFDLMRIPARIVDKLCLSRIRR